MIVGTPGRVMDHIRRGTLSLDGIKTLVLDEADEMLNMGFAEDIDWIFEQAPTERQVALFSATMPPAIRRVAQDHLIDPVEVRIESATETVDTIDQHHCIVTRFHKLDVLTRILELEPFDGMLIFVRTKNATTELADKLRAHGFAAEPLNGDMNQEMRERTSSVSSRASWTSWSPPTWPRADWTWSASAMSSTTTSRPIPPPMCIASAAPDARGAPGGHPAGRAARARSAAGHRAHHPPRRPGDGRPPRRAERIAHRPLHRGSAQDDGGAGSRFLLSLLARIARSRRSR